MILTDSGPLIALPNRGDEDHELCRSTLASVAGPMLTSTACLTEALHLANARSGWAAQDALLKLVTRGDLVVADLTTADLERCRALMARYRNVPMDFADATLVVVAERRRLHRIFTLDSDFRIYRVGRACFELIP